MFPGELAFNTKVWETSLLLAARNMTECSWVVCWRKSERTDLGKFDVDSGPLRFQGEFSNKVMTFLPHTCLAWSEPSLSWAEAWQRDLCQVGRQKECSHCDRDGCFQGIWHYFSQGSHRAFTSKSLSTKYVCEGR